MATYTFPEATELRLIEQDLLPTMEADDPVFFNELFPTETADTAKLEWEQRDNYFGLQQARGLDGQPHRVARVGSNRYVTEPGVYGEFVDVDEMELTRRAEPGRLEGRTIDVSDLVMQAQQHLLQRRIDRQRMLGWTLLTTGQFVVSSPTGGYEHRDRYGLKTITASPGFSASPTTALPFAFFRDLVLQGRGTSSAFDARAVCYVNQMTANKIMGTTDIRSNLRVGGGDTANRLGDFNVILKDEGLPAIKIYDYGYSTSGDTRGSFTPYIPNNVGVLVGKRNNGSPIGAYRMTINVHNGHQPGAYNIIKNTFGVDAPGKAVLQIHDGHNGGPVIFYPSAVVILQLG